MTKAETKAALLGLGVFNVVTWSAWTDLFIQHRTAPFWALLLVMLAGGYAGGKVRNAALKEMTD